MKVSEIFFSIQGEGVNIGEPAIFIRLAGCNLNCEWCDTTYAREGKEMTIEEVKQEIDKYDCSHLVITGGEPTLQLEEVIKLVEQLPHYYIEIETNGTINIPSYRFDLVTVSPKRQDIRRDVLKLLVSQKEFNTYFKFVVENEDNCAFWIDLIKELEIHPQRVIMMPEGTDDNKIKQTANWLVEICKENGYRFSPRLQIWLYGKKRGV